MCHCFGSLTRPRVSLSFLQIDLACARFIFDLLIFFRPTPASCSFLPPQDDRDNSFTKPYSEATANTIDEEVRKMVAASYARTVELIGARRSEVSQLAELLLSKETINVEDVVRLIGRRPFAYQGVPGAEYLQDSHKLDETAATAAGAASGATATADAAAGAGAASKGDASIIPPTTGPTL